MQAVDLREKIERSLPQLSSQDLVRVADLIERLGRQKTVPVDGVDRQARLQWIERLRRNRVRLSRSSGQQTVIEMRQEERY